MPRVVSSPRRALVIDRDAQTRSMLAEWLGADGWHVIEGVGEGKVEGDTDGEVVDADLVVLDVPFPREGVPDPLLDVRRAHPHAAVIVLSPTLFANVDCCGPCADALGVQGVLPKPVSRDALIDAARRVVSSRP